MAAVVYGAGRRGAALPDPPLVKLGLTLLFGVVLAVLQWRLSAAFSLVWLAILQLRHPENASFGPIWVPMLVAPAVFWSSLPPRRTNPRRRFRR